MDILRFFRPEEDSNLPRSGFLRMVSAPKRRSFQCFEIQSCLPTGTQLRLGMKPRLEFQEPAYDLFEKSLHLRISGVVATLQFAGPLPSRVTLSNFHSSSLQRPAPSFNVRAQRLNLVSCAPRWARFVPIPLPVS